MTNLYCRNLFSFFYSCCSVPTVDNGNTSKAADTNRNPSFRDAIHGCSPGNDIGYTRSDIQQVVTIRKAEPSEEKAICYTRPAIPEVVTIPKAERLEGKVRELTKLGISKKTIDFVMDTIANETNTITKQTIVNNLQRYAEICEKIHTYEAIKGLPLIDDVLSVIQKQLSEPLPVSYSEIGPHIVDNRKQIQNIAYLTLVSEQLSNAGINVPHQLIAQIRNYVEEHQDTKHVGVIMNNLHWYILTCHYCECERQLPKHVKVDGFMDTNKFPGFASVQNLLDCKDYAKLSLSFIFDKPKTDQTENTTTEYINHSEHVADWIPSILNSIGQLI